MQDILQAFGITAPVLAQETLSGGRIHGTYRLHTVQGDYIAQKLHPTAFPEPEQLMRHIVSVTDYLRSHFPDCVTLHFYCAQDGGYLYQGWRLSGCIPGVNVTSPTGAQIRAAGEAYGRFQAMLCGYEPEQEPAFHDPARYFAALDEAAKADPCGRLRSVQPVVSRLYALREKACALQRMKLPRRMLHNDTKLSNLLFDVQTGQPAAVIDLDTVGQGLAAYDFGDAVRSLHGHTAHFDPALTAQFAEGFLEGAAHLTQPERDSLLYGITAVTAELAARYLTDFLTGDSYFRSPDSPGRAEQLTALAEDIPV